MVKEFTALGYETDLQYAEDDIPNQLAQIENMVTKGAKVLVIAAIDGTTLSDVLKKAHEAGAKVIAYDRLIRKRRRRLLHHLRQLQGRRAAG
jgi:putative multiple sugar transport system substrate-binding protein